jgi:hypothetical protein
MKMWWMKSFGRCFPMRNFGVVTAESVDNTEIGLDKKRDRWMHRWKRGVSRQKNIYRKKNWKKIPL